MAYGIASNSNLTIARPSVTSYDSGYEHSLDRYVEVRLLVQNADQEAIDSPRLFAVAS